MNDPIQQVLDQLRSNRTVQQTHFTNNFLQNVGDVFEREGVATTRLFLQDKQGQSATRDQARALLTEVLPTLAGCQRILKNRAIGRYIIKALSTLQNPGGRR